LIILIGTPPKFDYGLLFTPLLVHSHVNLAICFEGNEATQEIQSGEAHNWHRIEDHHSHMPRPEHFGASSSRELLALPRPEPAAFAEGYCQLARYLLHGDAHNNITTIDGPLGPTDYGYVLEDTGVTSERPYKVRRFRGDYQGRLPVPSLGLPGTAVEVPLCHISIVHMRAPRHIHNVKRLTLIPDQQRHKHVHQRSASMLYSGCAPAPIC